MVKLFVFTSIYLFLYLEEVIIVIYLKKRSDNSQLDLLKRIMSLHKLKDMDKRFMHVKVKLLCGLFLFLKPDL